MLFRSPNSQYLVVANSNASTRAAYTGYIHIDPASLSVRRLILAADQLPDKFPIRESVLSIDYDYVPIGGQQFIVPVQATLFVREKAHYLRKNEITFSNYRKFTAESKIQ